jgi:hypothetical protein
LISGPLDARQSRQRCRRHGWRYFAAVQIHHYRQRRRRDAMIELLRSFQSRDFTRALRRVNMLPDGADLRKIREILGPDGADDVFMVGLT